MSLQKYVQEQVDIFVFRVLPEVGLTHLSKLRAGHFWQEVNSRKDDKVHPSNTCQVFLNLDSGAQIQSCYLQI